MEAKVGHKEMLAGEAVRPRQDRREKLEDIDNLDRAMEEGVEGRDYQASRGQCGRTSSRWSAWSVQPRDHGRGRWRAPRLEELAASQQRRPIW